MMTLKRPPAVATCAQDWNGTSKNRLASKNVSQRIEVQLLLQPQ